MPQIIAWQCPQTKQVFVEKQEYEKHLRALARDRRLSRKIAEKKRNFDQMMRDMRASVTAFPDIENWFLEPENARNFVARLIPSQRCKIDLDKFRFKTFQFDNMRWNMSCSNSHSAPIDKSTNWGGRQGDTPRGYPGWTGRLSYQYEGVPGGGLFTEMFAGVGICTGTGGSRGGSFSFSVTLWAEDWATMAVWNALSK